MRTEVGQGKETLRILIFTSEIERDTRVFLMRNLLYFGNPAFSEEIYYIHFSPLGTATGRVSGSISRYVTAGRVSVFTLEIPKNPGKNKGSHLLEYTKECNAELPVFRLAVGARNFRRRSGISILSVAPVP
jgi:hypothetical protein